MNELLYMNEVCCPSLVTWKLALLWESPKSCQRSQFHFSNEFFHFSRSPNFKRIFLKTRFSWFQFSKLPGKMNSPTRNFHCGSLNRILFSFWNRQHGLFMLGCTQIPNTQYICREPPPQEIILHLQTSVPTRMDF